MMKNQDILKAVSNLELAYLIEVKGLQFQGPIFE